MGISFISNIVLARLLSPNDYGCIGLLAIFIVVAETFINGGFGAALIQNRNDGEYTIVNMVAERAIRLMIVVPKNSLFFESTKGTLRSVIYNTFIETCKQAKISSNKILGRVEERSNGL